MLPYIGQELLAEFLETCTHFERTVKGVWRERLMSLLSERGLRRRSRLVTASRPKWAGADMYYSAFTDRVAGDHSSRGEDNTRAQVACFDSNDLPQT